MPRCKGCGAEIIFIKTSGGKSIPCNPDQYCYWAKKNGKDRIVTPNGEVISCELHGPFDKATGAGYEPHWATCPVADRFRSRKRAKWEDEPMTEKQRALIAEMNEFSDFPLPEFNGSTKGEAAKWIDENMERAHTSDVDITRLSRYS